MHPAFGPAPDGVEVCRRAGQGRQVYLLINHTRRAADVPLPRPMRDILGTGEEVRQARLGALQVSVLSEERQDR